MIWLVLHHFLALYDEVWSGQFDDEALKSLVVTACILLWLSA